MSSKFFTNDSNNTLLEKLAAVFKNNPQLVEFDALAAFFYATGYFRIRPYLKELTQIRVLVGIKTDGIIADTQQQGLSLQFGANAEDVYKDYQQQLKQDIDEADYKWEIKTSIQQFVDDIVSKKVIVKAHPSKKLHAKIYIFRPHPFNEHSGGEVISGSSNLTEAGLGANDHRSNYEFNVSLRDYDEVKFATDEFEKLWAESVDIPPDLISTTKDQTYLRDNFSSFEIYIKLLIEYFGNEIEFDPNSIRDLPPGFKRFNYQMDAVEQGYSLLNQHNGFFLSDVVGLGKTIVAILIARKYFYHNNYPEYRSHTLIVCPPAIKIHWQQTVREFKIDNVEFITSGSLHKILEPKKYDLIIVDEAHKFRNNTSDSYDQLQRICKTRCRNGQDKRVILVSATPLNNRPDDIKNQLCLFQDLNDSTLGINIARFFSEISKQYKQLIQSSTAKSNEKIKQLFVLLRNKVIEPLTVRRTRTDLTQHSLYKKDLQQQGIVFPIIHPPHNLLYRLDDTLNACYQQSFDYIRNADNKGLQYARYRLIEYLQPEHKRDYQRPEMITKQLAAIIRTLLIKRLDSSFYAFHQSLKRLLRAVDTVLKMVADNRIFIAPDHKIEEYIQEGREDELLDILVNEQLTDPSIKILTASDFDPALFELLAHDRRLLMEMESQWSRIVNDQPDPKLQLLLEELPVSLINPAQNPEQKLVIFSESIDTTKYLYNALRGKYQVLAISSRNRSQQHAAISQNFDANLPIEEQKSDYNILIATESLAEGVNLHRANTIVNYDIPWNATRLMQRIGRINRIGSRAPAIYIYNFFPTEQVEDEISLQHRAQIKLQAFHTALGEDSQIYTTDEEVQTFGLFDRNITEDQEISQRLAYLMEIRQYREDNPDEFKRIKDLPLKIRNIVTSSTLAGSSGCFLRSGKHNAFYRIDLHNDTDRVVELDFLEAVSVFKNHRDCPSQKRMPKIHYRQVQAAQRYFIEQAQTKMNQDQKAPDLSPQHREAIIYLQSFLGSNISNEDETKRINQALELVKRGRYQSLPRNIVKLRRRQKKHPAIAAKQLEALLTIITKYAPDLMDLDEAPRSPQSTLIKPPTIVISQTYLAPPQTDSDPLNLTSSPIQKGLL